MNKKQRASLIMNRLDRLYPSPPIPLQHRNHFTLLIAVMFSAQCTDKKVNEVTKGLFSRAFTPKAMYELGVEEIYRLIKTLGLARQKANYAHQLSKIIIDAHSGNIPKDITALESLPGVGHKTASVVISQAFGIPAFPVDTHIHRIAQRWEFTSGKSVRETEEDLKRIFPKASWNKLHLQIIYYGREYCTARGCDGTICPLCKEQFPKRKYPVDCKKA